MPTLCQSCGRTSGKCEACIRVDAMPPAELRLYAIKAMQSQTSSEALREFADSADVTAQMVVRTFGDRANPPKMLDAFATITMCKKLSEQYAALPAAPQLPKEEA